MKYSGTVRDAVSGNPIRGAVVHLDMDGEDVGAFPTDEGGRFRNEEEGQSPGRFLSYSVTKDGYQPLRDKYAVHNRTHVDLSTLELIPEGAVFPPVTPEPQPPEPPESDEPVIAHQRVSVQVQRADRKRIAGAHVEAFKCQNLQAGSTASDGRWYFDDDDLTDNETIGVFVTKEGYHPTVARKSITNHHADFKVTLSSDHIPISRPTKENGIEISPWERFKKMAAKYGPAVASGGVALLLLGTLAYCYWWLATIALVDSDIRSVPMRSTSMQPIDQHVVNLNV